MRRFVATTILVLVSALPVQAAPLVHASPIDDLTSWLASVRSWVIHVLPGEKDGTTDSTGNTDDFTPPTPPTEETARGEICGNG